MAERSHPTLEARGGTRGQGQRQKGQGGDREEQPHAQGVVAARAQEGLEEPSHVEGQEGRQEEIPLIQVKEQRLLCWSSREEIPHAQGKRNPSKMVGVARRHQRADTLKPYSQKTSQSNHTRTTALSNSMKLSHACGATQDGWVMMERSDRMWSTGEGNGKPLQYSCLEDSMNSMKRQNGRILKEVLPRSIGAQYATGGQWRNNSRKNEEMEPKQKQYPAVDVTGDRNKV